MTLSEVRAVLAARLATVPGLRVHLHPVPNQATPAAVISMPVVDYHESSGIPSAQWVVMVGVGRVSERSAAAKLLEYMEPSTGIKAALEIHDPNLSVKVATSESILVDISGVDYWAVEFQVRTIS